MTGRESGQGSPRLVLEMRDVGMRFGETWVLRHVDFMVERGSIHALVGHNGAGKSTLMKIALGVVAPTEGTVDIAGAPLTFSRPAESRALGLGMVFQERSLVRTLTGLDNIFLNDERVNHLGIVNTGAQLAEARGLCERLGISPSVLRRKVADLSPVEQELVEIAKALRLAREVLVLDEPTAPLTEREISVLFRVMRNVADSGSGIVLITHHLPEVFAISDWVTTLREGAVTLSAPTARSSMNQVIDAMLGSKLLATERKISTESARTPPAHRDTSPALQVRGLRVGEKLKDISFDVYPSEILGVAGLAGSGRTTLLRAVFGDIEPTSGEMLLNGRTYRPRTPGDAIRRSVYLIPEERGVFGLVLPATITENTILPILWRLTRRALLRANEGIRLTRRLMTLLGIRARTPQQPVGELSGGNQQKVVLAKALAADAALLLLDEPTFGVDVGAASDLIKHVREMVDRGRASIWVTSDTRELLEVSDRILILVGGTVQRVIERSDASFDEATLVKHMQRVGNNHVAVPEASRA